MNRQNEDGHVNGSSVDTLVPNIFAEADLEGEEWTKLSTSTFMYNVQPLSAGTEVFRGVQTHATKARRDLAVKLVRSSKKHLNEVDMLVKLTEHPNIIRIVESGVFKGAYPLIYIAMDLCRQNLREYINQSTFELKKAEKFFEQTVKAVVFIHSNQITHRDLKPDNILISFDENVKLSDFGISKEISAGRSVVTVTSQGAGTEGFKAPEAYLGKPKTGYKADVFSLAINGYFMFTHGRHPFGENPLKQPVNIINNKNLTLSLVPGLTQPHKREQLLDLFQRMLAHEPHNRPTAENVSNDKYFRDQQGDLTQIVGQLMTVRQGSGTLEISNAVINIHTGGVKRKCSSRDPSVTSPSEDQSLGVAKKCSSPDQRDTALAEDQSPGDEVESEQSTPPPHPHHPFQQPNSLESAIVIFDNISKHLRRFNPETGKMKRMHEYADDMKRHNFTACSIEDDIYVLVGPSLYKSSCRDVRPTWERMAELVQDHGLMPRAVSASGTILVVGGSGYSLNKSTSQYIPSQNQWKTLAEKKLVTRDSAMTGSHDYLYCAGGYIREHGSTNQVEKLSLTTNIWDEIDPMLEARRSASAIEYDGDLFVLGGRGSSDNNLDSVEKYLMSAQQWSFIAPMKLARCKFLSHALNKSIFVIGGDDGNSLIEKLEDDCWSAVEVNKQNIEIHLSVCVKMPEA